MTTEEKKVDSLLRSIKDEQKQRDCFALLDLMKNITGEEPKIWRGNMVGFGSYKYKYDSGRQGEWLLTGFAARSKNIVVYIIAGFPQFENLMAKLGKHKTGSSCLYINKLQDVDIDILKELIEKSIKQVVEKTIK